MRPADPEVPLDPEVPSVRQAPAAASTGAWLGVDLVERFSDQAMVLRVHPDSPAERAGIRPNDIILSVAGERVLSRDHLIELIGQMRPGSDVEIEIDRDRRRRITDAILSRRDDYFSLDRQYHYFNSPTEPGPLFTNDPVRPSEQTQESAQMWEVRRMPPRDERSREQRPGLLRRLFGRR